MGADDGRGACSARSAPLSCRPVLLGILGFGDRTIPASGPPSTRDAARGRRPTTAPRSTSQALHVPGLTRPVTVSFTKDGLASINASDDSDLFLALGYVQAKYRLSEMDLERRLGEGQLAQLGGPPTLPATSSSCAWACCGPPRTSGRGPRAPPGRAARLRPGVNDDIAQVRASGDWPALFTLTGPHPRPWTPVDSLVVQGC